MFVFEPVYDFKPDCTACVRWLLPDTGQTTKAGDPKKFTAPISLILNHFLVMSILWMLKLVSPVLCFQCVHSLIRFCDFFAVPQKLREIFARKSDHCQLWSRWDRRFRRRRRIPTNGPFSRYSCRCSRMSSWWWWWRKRAPRRPNEINRIESFIPLTQRLKFKHSTN